MNKPHILICVEKPKDYSDESKKTAWPAWLYFADEYEKLALPFEPHERPAENVWLLDASTRLKSASQILVLLARCRVSHSSFTFTDAPQPAA